MDRYKDLEETVKYNRKVERKLNDLGVKSAIDYYEARFKPDADKLKSEWKRMRAQHFSE